MGAIPNSLSKLWVESSAAWDTFCRCSSDENFQAYEDIRREQDDEEIALYGHVLDGDDVDTIYNEQSPH